MNAEGERREDQEKSRESGSKFAELERAVAARRSGIHGRFVLVLSQFWIKKKVEGEKRPVSWGVSNRLQMPLLEKARCVKVGPSLRVQSHPLEKRALLYCKGALGTLWGSSMALGWGAGWIQGGPVFSTAASSIEARAVMGALGALQGI